MLISDSHFVLLLLSSLFLPAAPIIDTGSTQPPAPTPTAQNIFGMQPVLYAQRRVSALHLSSAITDQLTPALPVQIIIVVLCGKSDLIVACPLHSCYDHAFSDLFPAPLNNVLRTKPKKPTYHPNTTQVFPK
jgi:hypothetical protein